MKPIEKIMLDNHLAFLTSHRGIILKSHEFLSINSDQPEFCYGILEPNSKIASLPKDLRKVQHFPWCEITIEELNAAGFAALNGFSYMLLNENSPEWNITTDLVIESVSDAARMDVFSEVQSRGFIESQADYEIWHPWLKKANLRNLNNPNHFFYIGSEGSKAIGVALTVVDGGTAGIYAVATLPNYRKKGVSTTIMKKAISDAQAIGCNTITLQVIQDSYVENFYQHLGFKREFTSTMFKRK